MSALPVLSGKKLVRILLKNGFVAVRKKGSHVFIQNAASSQGTVIPMHGNEDLGKGLLKSILSDLHLDADALNIMLQK